jgi:hypothetical protein
VLRGRSWIRIRNEAEERSDRLNANEKEGAGAPQTKGIEEGADAPRTKEDIE